MWKRHQLRSVFHLFGGMDVNSTPDIASKKGKAEYILNCYSYPEGAVSKFFGRSAHNTTMGSAAEVTGIYELKVATPALFYISEAKFYKDDGGTPVDKTGGVTIADSKNNLWSFSKFQDQLIGTCLSRNPAIEHDGGSGNAAAVSNMPAGKFNAVLKNRLFSLNTAAQPKLAYYSGLNDRTSWDTTNDYLNLKASEGDDEPIEGAVEHLDNIILAKESNMFRVYHTGTSPPFKYYRIGGQIGSVSPLTMKSLPAVGQYPPRLIWMGKDNFYQLIGDTIIAAGDDIKPMFSEGNPLQINLSRLQYCSSGLIKEKNLYLTAFSSGSGASHDYILVLDYKNMWWFLCDFNANSFGIRKVSGRDFLYSGNYAGVVCKHDPAVFNNLGAAYSGIYVTSWIQQADTQKEESMQYLVALLDAVGDFDVQVEYRTNLATDWVDLGDFSSSAAGVKLGIDWVLGTSVLGGAELTESVLEVIKRFKRVQFRFTQASADEYFRMYGLATLWRKMPGYRIGVTS